MFQSTAVILRALRSLIFSGLSQTPVLSTTSHNCASIILIKYATAQHEIVSLSVAASRNFLITPRREFVPRAESSQLLTLITNQEQAASERPEALCVFDRKRVYRVELRIPGREQLDVDYPQVLAGRETRVRNTLQDVHVLLDSNLPGETREDGEPFSFLGAGRDSSAAFRSRADPVTNP
jgi:hypothetical protein